MEFDRGWLVVCGIVGFVLLVNIGLAYSLFSGGAREQLDLIGRALRRARDPWQDEDRDLAQLRDLVDGFGPADRPDRGPPPS